MSSLIGLILICAGARSESFIRVRPHVVAAPGTDVKLFQLVDVQDLSQAAQAALHSTSIARAPELGGRQELTQASLMEVLRPLIQAERSGSRKQVHLLIPKTVIVDTMRRELTADAVWSELLEVWQPLCADCKLEAESLSLPAVQGVRDWSLKVKADLPRGSFSVPVSIVRADSAPVNAWVTGRLIAKRKVPVVKRAMAPLERIQDRDVAWEYRDVSMATDGIPQAEEIVGRQVKQGLRAGDVLWAGQLAKEMAVRRGEQVAVRVGGKDWEVSMTLVAQQDAVIGDTINLRNPKNNNMMVGQVVGHGEVELR